MVRKYLKLNITLVSVWLICGSAMAKDLKGDIRSVTASGQSVIIGNASYEEAKSKAINQARALAVEKAAGVAVSGFTILNNNLIVADYIKTFSKGFIVDETVLSWNRGWLKSSLTGDPDFPVLNVTIKADILVPAASYYRRGLLQVRLNKNSYRNGDKASIAVTASRPMRIILANYTSTGKVIHLYPNQYYQSQVINTGETLAIPNQNQSGINIEMSVAPDQEQSTEAFIVIGIPESDSSNINWSEKFKTNKTVSYSEYMKKIVDLPVSWITEEIKPFSIKM